MNNEISTIQIILIIIFALIVATLLFFIIKKIWLLNKIKFKPNKIQKPELIKNKHFITSDGFKLKTIGEINENGKEIYIAIHDLGLNKNEFVNLINNFKTNKNNSLISFDQRTFGENDVVNDRKHNSYLGTTFNDLSEIVSQIKEKYPNQKINLIGSGYGANIVLLFSIKNFELINNVFLLSLVTRNPYVKSSNIFKSLVYPFNSLIQLSIEGNDLTNSKEYAKYINESILSKGQITLRDNYQLQKIIQKVVKKSKKIKNKTLILSSTNDIFANADRMAKLYNNIDNQFVNFKFVDNQKHSILLSDDNDDIEEIIKLIEEV